MTKPLIPILSLFLLCGCAHRLAPEGVYRGDTVLFDADETLTTGWDLLEAFVKWEHDFRPMLAAAPEVKEAADNIRLHAKEWFKTGFALRDAYAATPSDGTRNALTVSLSVIKTALLESSAYLAKYGPQKPTP